MSFSLDWGQQEARIPAHLKLGGELSCLKCRI